jgi:hypothetical protein
MPDLNRNRPATAPARATLATAALAVLVALAAAGCDHSTPEPGTGQAGLGAGPTPPADLSPAPPSPDAPPAESPFPDTPREYAEAVIAAWHAPDPDRLAELTTAVVHDQIISIPGPPPADWTWIQCDNVAYCTFYNSAGDYLALQVPVASLGAPHAAAQVAFTQTTYPHDHLDYLKEFTAAWLNGNVARMHQLARPEVVQVYQDRSAAPVANYGLAGGGGGLSIVIVTGPGFEVETHIGTTLLGGPQAIIHAVPET